MKVCVQFENCASTVNNVLCNLMTRACRSVLTFHILSTYKESGGGELEFQNRSSGLHSLCRFQFDPKRTNFDAPQIKLVDGNNSKTLPTDDEESLA
jgi:hypothetical protein